MIETPFGYIKAVTEESLDYPGVRVLLCDSEGNEIEAITVVEYDKEHNRIQTFCYKEGEIDFDKKCVYKRGER